MSKGLASVMVLTWEMGGDGRNRRGTTYGLVDAGEVSFLEQFYDVELGKDCCRLFMKNGEKHEIVGGRSKFLDEVERLERLEELVP